MKVWVDAQLSPAIAPWLASTFGVDAAALRDKGFLGAEDADIFFAARKDAEVVMTKDSDFIDLVLRHGPPPQIVWITCGNSSNRRLKEILTVSWDSIVTLLKAGERIIEVSDRIT